MILTPVQSGHQKPDKVYGSGFTVIEFWLHHKTDFFPEYSNLTLLLCGQLLYFVLTFSFPHLNTCILSLSQYPYRKYREKTASVLLCNKDTK